MRISNPKRVSRSYTQRLCGAPSEVFALLCPVREADWIEGWDPLLVLSESGWAEKDCVFVTRDGQEQATWIITQHEPEAGRLEMLKLLPAVSVCKLSIQLAPDAIGCAASITYAHTSLSAAGDALLASFTEEHFSGFMQTWEARMNHYLQHASMLTDPGA